MNPRTILAALFMLPAIACTAFATYLFKTGASSATYTDPLLALILGTIFLVISLWLTYAVPYPQPQQEPERKPQRPNGFSLVQLMVVICVAAILMAVVLPALTGAFRGATQPQIDAKLRELALEKMYEDAGLTREQAWAKLTRAELARRGHPWPYAETDTDPTHQITGETLDAHIAAISPPLDPVFATPNWTTAQSVTDLGFTEPTAKEAKALLGMQ